MEWGAVSWPSQVRFPGLSGPWSKSVATLGDHRGETTGATTGATTGRKTARPSLRPLASRRKAAHHRGAVVMPRFFRHLSERMRGSASKNLFPPIGKKISTPFLKIQVFKSRNREKGFF